ncbi:MAG: hypothetical protein LDL41_21040 [Coleofasciculus sp. S288]|nr:hypothetical protein [Coleofasciculus sp. S288]
MPCPYQMWCLCVSPVDIDSPHPSVKSQIWDAPPDTNPIGTDYASLGTYAASILTLLMGTDARIYSH